MIHTVRVFVLFAMVAFSSAQAESAAATLQGHDLSGGVSSVGAAEPQRIFAAPLGLINSFSEGFEDITSLPGAGWAQINNSSPIGSTNWFQGVPNVFPSHQGEPNHYIAANFNNVAGNGLINNWLITPEVTLKNGTTLSFLTRTTDANFPAPDRLEVRLSTNGASTDVGDIISVGDFTTLMLTINPDLSNDEYPVAWTRYTLIVADLPAPTSGRFAFRYFVNNAGPSGSNGDYIGIDSVSVAPDDVLFADGFESPAPP